MRNVKLLFVFVAIVVALLILMLIHAWLQLQDLDARRQQTRDRTHSALTISAVDQRFSPFPDTIQVE